MEERGYQDMLFAPKEGNGYGEDEDHLALMMELLGKMPREIAIRGARSKYYFDRHGDLKRIRRLKYWPMDWLLVDKDKLQEAKEFAELETTYCSTVLGTSMDECNLSRFLSNRRRVSPSLPQPCDAINATAATFNGKKTQETRIAVDTGHYKSTATTRHNSAAYVDLKRFHLSYKDEEIKRMINKITDGEFGQGEWFLVLISACCYVLVRREGKGVLSMGEISEEVGIDLHQLGSMVKRVVEYLGFELEEYDLVGLFVKTVNDSSRLRGVDVKKKKRLKVADLAKDCKVSLVTCKTRYKELSEKLVKVAREVGLPWARDVTVKNVVRHSGVLFGLMEEKSMRKRRDESVRSDGVCLKEIVRDCLNKEAKYSYDDDDDDDGGVRRSGFEMVSSEDWWKGRSKMSQRLTLKEVLEKDVGLDDLPPYIKGCASVERRREKIKAAKLRINAIQHPCDKISGSELCLEIEHMEKKRKIGSEINQEDLVIETLLLHSVSDEEIEKGITKLC
ncbi:hypothetical protein F2Q69_00008955 [Brassica cretica]|uniref:Uncharacterized protein n=1 Tax=Brassica cretica TaxID=69181 RepID=A0A8S9P0W6_BRACR|nr:hypothetical protein F2Q69_00008955 [Brassica cretica]